MAKPIEWLIGGASASLFVDPLNVGAGDSISHDEYVQPRLILKVGGETATLRDVPILPSRMNAGIDILFGNLGQDFVDGFERFTLDFRTMTFAFGAPRVREL
jgi:hypothetical protein